MEGVETIGSNPHRSGDRSSGWELVMLSIALLLILCSFWSIMKVYANPGTETLRPSGVGSFAQLTPVGATYNWQCVDEEGADEDTTYVKSSSTSWKTDTYLTQDHSTGSGTINKVTIYVRCKSSNTFGEVANARTALRTHSKTYNGSTITLTGSYANYYTDYATNPYSSSAWTWSEVDDMEVGVGGKNSGFYGWLAYCTQVWAVVDYTPPTPEFPYGAVVALAIGFVILMAKMKDLKRGAERPFRPGVKIEAFIPTIDATSAQA